jgi:hypothetical protein
MPPNGGGTIVPTPAIPRAREFRLRERPQLCVTTAEDVALA